MDTSIYNPANFDLIVILGPTATGKTGIAAQLAYQIGSEIISADSRQVYRGMDLGTGKDYDDYVVKSKSIPYHLIDIVDSGYKYNVFEYQADFLKAYNTLKNRGITPILCGGTGMYIEAVLNAYQLLPVPPNPDRRAELELIEMEELTKILESMTRLHNTTDLSSKKRIIRAIEIAEYSNSQKMNPNSIPGIKPIIFGIDVDRDTRRNRITERLKIRLKSGMIEEVQNLLKTIPAEDLIYYGLEYKYLTLYCTGKISYEDLFQKLNIAIHQFAKRQMTWFRKMERNGHQIIWIDGKMDNPDKIAIMLEMISKAKS